MQQVRNVGSKCWHKTESLRMYVWQRWHNSGCSSTSVFLVGCGRSGTNMITRSLSNSWQVKLYNEDHPAAFDNYRLRSLTTLASLIENSCSQIVLFKPILDTHFTIRLMDRFPESKALFAFRHYNDVINSGLKRFGPENWPSRVKAWISEDFAEYQTVPPSEVTKQYITSLWTPMLSTESSIGLYWLFYNRLYFDLNLDVSQRVRLIQYEAMVLAPEPQFSALCQYLKIKYWPRIIERVRSSSIRRYAPQF